MAWKRKRKLPPEPTGYELADVLWADAAWMAPALLAMLPVDVDPDWATGAAAETMLAVHDQLRKQRAEVSRTAAQSTMRRLRQRELLRLERMQTAVYWNVAAALALKAKAEHPKASPAQVFILIKEEVRALLTATLAAA